jgi:hypothetical protein
MVGTRIGLDALRLAFRLPGMAFELTVDRVLAGPLTDAVARSIAEHRVIERVASQVVATVDFERIVDEVLDDARTEAIVVRVLESRFLDDLTDRVLASPEMQRVIQHIAGSPEVLAAVSVHTETMAEEMLTDVRRRTRAVDDVAERTVRTLLRRRPRPQPA